MQTNLTDLNYITVSKAISLIKTRIQIAAFIMLVIVLLSLLLPLAFHLSYFWIPIGIIISFFSFILYRSWYTLKWKIYAYKNVDNLSELIIRSLKFRILDDTGLELNKWTVGSTANKKLLLEIALKRINEDNFVAELNDDNSLPHTLIVTGSKTQNLTGLVVCFAISWLPLKRLISDTSKHIETDYIMVSILLLIALHFITKVILPNTKITLSNHGMWSRKSDFQKWNAIENIRVDSKTEHNNRQHSELIILFNATSGLQENKREIKFNIKDLNKSADEIEYAIKIYRKRFEKRSGHGKTQIPSDTIIDNTGTSIADNITSSSLKLLAGGMLVILLGCYMLYRTLSVTKENCYKIEGHISYLEDSFGKYKNKSTKFLKLKEYEEVFSLFIGHGQGDFSPQMERINELHIDDAISLYMPDQITIKHNYEIKDETLNKNVAFIEKNGQDYFIQGDQKKYIAYFILGAGALLLVFSLISRISSHKKHSCTRN